MIRSINVIFNILYDITYLITILKYLTKELSGLNSKKCLRTKYDQTFCINRDLKMKTNDDIYIEIYIVEACKNLIEFETINSNISELQLRFGN